MSLKSWAVTDVVDIVGERVGDEIPELFASNVCQVIDLSRDGPEEKTSPRQFSSTAEVKSRGPVLEIVMTQDFRALCSEWQ